MKISTIEEFLRLLARVTRTCGNAGAMGLLEL